MQHDYYGYDQDWEDEPAMIQTVTYARLYNLGNYENEKIEITISVEDDDAAAAYAIARATVEQLHRGPIAGPAPKAPATDKQRNYIAVLQDNLGWSSEQMAVYAKEQQIDLIEMTLYEASTLIEGMKRLDKPELPF